MKPKLLAVSLLAATGAAVGLVSFTNAPVAVAGNPPQPPVVTVAPQTHAQSKVEVVFVLDTTGSMGGLIQAAKEKIWSIATTLASAKQQPEIRVGLVAYRDRGDNYVTHVVDLSSDLDSIYATLMDFAAAGGGDGPESVNQALYDAVHRVSWSTEQDVYRAVFLVGDAPPHMDYRDDVKYPHTLREAKRRSIVVNAIQAGRNAGARRHWQRIAQAGDGVYAQVEQAGSAVAIATPFDERLARLSEELDDTRMFYGDAEKREVAKRKTAATTKLHDKASLASRARRATFNASASGKKNLLGDADLVDDVSAGRVTLDEVPAAHLPQPLQSLPREEQSAAIAEAKQRRDSLSRQIDDLVKKRESYLRDQVKADGGAKESLDQKLFDAVRSQAGKSGLSYSADGPSY